MSKMILGRKLGMTQIFRENGDMMTVTVVKAGPMVVVQKKSSAGKDGYAAVKVGFEPATKQEKDGDVRWRGLTKADVGVFEKAGIETPMKHVREFRVNEEDLDKYEVGATVDFKLFAVNDVVDVAGTSKGRGFTGVMKRHNFAGFKASHGVHESYRGGGSVGGSADPARTFKGWRMAGQHGRSRVTVQNLRIVGVEENDGVYLIKGAVPGPNGGLVEIYPAVKKSGGARPR